MATKDLLASAKSKAKKAEPKAKKTEIRQIVVTDPEILTLIEIASLTGDLKPLEEQHKGVVQSRLFDMWTEEMWRDKKKPDNFKAVIKKPNGLDDARCNFILKVNAKGLAKVAPDDSALPKNDDGEVTKTVQEVLAEMISEQCGLTPANAKKFTNEEVEITDEINLADTFDKMYYGSDESKKKIAGLLLAYIQARPAAKAKTNKVTVDAFDDELQENTLVTRQVVILKDGMEERVFTYCDSLEQLRKLLDFCCVTKQVSNFEFAVSDDPKTKHERHRGVVDKYLIPSQS